jgi:hypothetical protein
MDLLNEYKEHQGYIKAEGLDRLIDFKENINYIPCIFDSVCGDLDIPFPPQAGDLVNLHKAIRERKCFTVLEFGIGYSSIIIADALKKNMKDWQELSNPPEIRNRFMFKLFSVDTSPQWIKHVDTMFPDSLRDIIELHQSGVEVGTFNGQLCHYYKNLPDIVPDFIYLDGPNPKDVKGRINGLSFQCDERTVMAADLLLMEPTFLPGTYILIDGRTNNARFLENNFKRKYFVVWDPDKDITTFELSEKRLGKYNLLGSDYF